MKEKKYSRNEIYEIIDAKIKKEMEYKNRYIELNGYKHKNVLESFANRIAAYSELYSLFK